MPELLTHVLFAYGLVTLLSRRYEWITSRFVTVAMIGATIPDFTRLNLVVPAATVESAIGIPFSWSPLHQLGGAVIVCLIGATIVTPRYRHQVLFLLALGAGSHFLLDAFLYKPSGLAYPFFWPLSDTRLVINGIYVSSDRWSALVATGIWFEAYYTGMHGSHCTRCPARQMPADLVGRFGGAVGRGRSRLAELQAGTPPSSTSADRREGASREAYPPSSSLVRVR